jgi:hypothetical protein
VLTFLKSLIAPSCQLPAPRDPSARLCLENLEERLALSATPSVPLPPPKVDLVAPVAHHAKKGIEMPVAHHAEKDIGMPVAHPETPVHGYKWRRRPWWPYASAEAQTGAHAAILAVAQSNVQHQQARAAHLVVGGVEQILVTISGEGKVVKHVPEGPLPTELGAVKQ